MNYSCCFCVNILLNIRYFRCIKFSTFGARSRLIQLKSTEMSLMKRPKKTSLINDVGQKMWMKLEGVKNACQTIRIICTSEQKQRTMNAKLKVDYFECTKYVHALCHRAYVKSASINEFHWKENTKSQLFSLESGNDIWQANESRLNDHNGKNQHNNANRLLFCPWNCQDMVFGLQRVRGRFFHAIVALVWHSGIPISTCTEK